ncbi:hypothetical protein NE237_030163 [Protea cynaroides]|uniref:Uncharacterized protein n=1 Tax=Protea cynaroides TaxID=273540 RepID=A0A9Q0GSI0_9MAGN|nr:hypothetical protein NE237_030163 [Protea cynaroides]
MGAGGAGGITPTGGMASSEGRKVALKGGCWVACRALVTSSSCYSTILVGVAAIGGTILSEFAAVSVSGKTTLVITVVITGSSFMGGEVAVVDVREGAIPGPRSAVQGGRGDGLELEDFSTTRTCNSIAAAITFHGSSGSDQAMRSASECTSALSLHAFINLENSSNPRKTLLELTTVGASSVDNLPSTVLTQFCNSTDDIFPSPSASMYRTTCSIWLYLGALGYRKSLLSLLLRQISYSSSLHSSD